MKPKSDSSGQSLKSRQAAPYSPTPGSQRRPGLTRPLCDHHVVFFQIVLYISGLPQALYLSRSYQWKLFLLSACTSRLFAALHIIIIIILGPLIRLADIPARRSPQHPIRSPEYLQDRDTKLRRPASPAGHPRLDHCLLRAGTPNCPAKGPSTWHPPQLFILS